MVNLFGSLGNLGDSIGELMKGISGIIPFDDADMKIVTAKTELHDLEKQERQLYCEIGRQAVLKYGAEGFGETEERLKLVQTNIKAAQQKLAALELEKQTQEKAAQEAMENRTCPICGYENPDGTKFCQECGFKIDVRKSVCESCGHENPLGTRFCQECGARMDKASDKSCICPLCGAKNTAGTRFCGECGGRVF